MQSKMKTLPKHMRTMNRIGSVAYQHEHLGKSIKALAYEHCTTEDIIEDIIDNYEAHQDKICGWEGED